MLAKSNRWQRLRMVTGSFCTSVVAKMNLTCGGGSSSVLSRASNACLLNMCVSSMMYTLNRARCGRKPTLARSSRASATPLLLAASISTASTSSPAMIARQMSQRSHGVGVGPVTQLSALARMRAVLVLPMPRAPVNR